MASKDTDEPPGKGGISLPLQPTEIDEAFKLSQPVNYGFCDAYVNHHAGDRRLREKRQKHWYTIDPSRKEKKAPKHILSKSLMKGREKRKMRLHSIPKDKSIKYADMIGLHSMWLEYMTESLRSPFDHKMDLTTSLSREVLIRADYHGAMCRVTQSKCPPHVNTEGIIILETKGMFQILQQNDRIKCIPKKGSIFSMMIDGNRIDLIGTNFMSRPTDRVKAKMKNPNCIDL